MSRWLFLLAACGGRDCPPYAEVAAILERSCSSCHAESVRGANRQSAPRDAIYDTEEQARAAASELGQRVDDGMPPASASVPRLSAAERQVMRDWGECQ